MIHEGRVAINGKVTENPDQWVDPKTDKLTIDGRPLEAYLTPAKPATLFAADGGPTYFEFGCNDAIAINALDQVTIVFRLALEGENPTNDYSYVAGTQYSVDSHIVLAQGSTVLFGTAP